MISLFASRPYARAPKLVGLIVMLTLTACAGLPRGDGSIVPLPAGQGVTVAATQNSVSASRTVYYVTDRQPVSSSSGHSEYGIKRSASMAFGEVPAVVDTRGKDFAARELIRFPETPVPFSQHDGRIIPDPAGQRAYQASSNAFKARIATALKNARTRDVIVYIHGFRNDFDQSMETAQTLWRTSGYVGVPVVFSWPAGNHGLFGYFKDTESGEFAVFHLKETLRILAEVPGLRSIQIIAHSRGADATTTALREMVIAARASGRNPRKVLKIDNLILAAPDLDFSVVRQRLMAEHFGPAFGRVSVYMNPKDGTLALAQDVMSGTRFGRLSYSQMDANDRKIFEQIRNVDFIDVENVVRKSGHGYFHKNPAVMADIAALLQHSLPPGDPGRYLISQGGNYWKVINPPSRKIASGARGGEAR